MSIKAFEKASSSSLKIKSQVNLQEAYYDSLESNVEMDNKQIEVVDAVYSQIKEYKKAIKQEVKQKIASLMVQQQTELQELDPEAEMQQEMETLAMVAEA